MPPPRQQNGCDIGDSAGRAGDPEAGWTKGRGVARWLRSAGLVTTSADPTLLKAFGRASGVGRGIECAWYPNSTWRALARDDGSRYRATASQDFPDESGFFVPEGRLCHEYWRAIVNEDARGWNTERVNRMMALRVVFDRWLKVENRLSGITSDVGMLT
jgi:hypothetical protein